MLRTDEQREERQAEMRVRMGAEPDLDLLNVDEAAALLRVSRRTAYRLLLHEPGVNLFRTPGSKKPILRVSRSVVERLLRKTANP